MVRVLSVGLVITLLIATSQAEQWPGWRGPRHDGTSTVQSLPLTWSADKNIAWKTKIEGTGHSSPIIWNDQIFLTTCNLETKERKLLCLQRQTGALLWERVVLIAPLEKKHQLNSYASSTPITDGEHVWVTFLDSRRFLIVCYDMAGKEMWRQSPGEFYSMHGFCSPPTLYKSLVIVNGDHDVPDENKLAYLVALDKTTGQEVWRADRPNRIRSYCPPVVFSTGSRDQLVISGSKCVASYDPNTGKELWIIDGPTEQFAASLVQHDDLLFMTGGFPERHIMGIRSDGSGNVTTTHVVWHHPKGAAYVPSPIAVDHLLYMVTDEGILHCFDTKTGQRHYERRLNGKFLASPITAAGYAYFPDQAGVTHVIKVGQQFDEVARNDLKEDIFASPAVSGKNLFLRTVTHLFCIGETPK
jgi:outer membrane protein assembly factor BamB